MAAKWKYQAEMINACNCDWGCPCNFNAISDLTGSSTLGGPSGLGPSTKAAAQEGFGSKRRPPLNRERLWKTS